MSNDELLALATALAEDQDLDWIAALALAQEIAPDLGRFTFEWDYAAFVAGNQTAVDVTSN